MRTKGSRAQRADQCVVNEAFLLFENRVAPIAEAPASLNWRVAPAAYQELRAHPAVAGILAEARRPELKEVRRKWEKRG